MVQTLWHVMVLESDFCPAARCVQTMMHVCAVFTLCLRSVYSPQQLRREPGCIA